MRNHFRSTEFVPKPVLKGLQNRNSLGIYQGSSARLKNSFVGHSSDNIAELLACERTPVRFEEIHDVFDYKSPYRSRFRESNR